MGHTARKESGKVPQRGFRVPKGCPAEKCAKSVCAGLAKKGFDTMGEYFWGGAISAGAAQYVFGG